MAGGGVKSGFSRGASDDFGLYAAGDKAHTLVVAKVWHNDGIALRLTSRRRVPHVGRFYRGRRFERTAPIPARCNRNDWALVAFGAGGWRAAVSAAANVAISGAAARNGVLRGAACLHAIGGVSANAKSGRLAKARIRRTRNDLEITRTRPTRLWRSAPLHMARLFMAIRQRPERL
jgi:hypothetical protein